MQDEHRDRQAGYNQAGYRHRPDRLSRCVRRREQQPVGHEQAQMPGEEDPPTAEPVGGVAERHGQQQERARRTERQEREPALGQIQTSL